MRMLSIVLALAFVLGTLRGVDPPPVITAMVTSGIATESSPIPPGVVTFSRSGPVTSALTIALGIGGTATPGSDYLALPPSLTFPAGQATAAVTVSTVNNAVHEDPETVIVTSVPGAGYVVGAPASGTVTIADDDLPVVTVQATDPTASESASGADIGSFTVFRTGSTSLSLRVNVRRLGSATAGGDYLLDVSDTIPLIIPPGRGAITLLIRPIDDAMAEGTETVQYVVDPGSSYAVGTPASALVSIVDNDAAPAATVTIVVDALAREPNTVGRFMVSRTGPTTSSLTVALAPPGGTASAGIDYAALPTSVTIPATTNIGFVQLTPIDDALAEGAETVILALAPGAGYTIGTPGSATTSIIDDELPLITILSSDVITPLANEYGGFGSFLITRTGPIDLAPLTVNIAMSGTALNGVDYPLIGGTVTIPINESSTFVSLAPIPDGVVEGPEEARMTALPGPGYQVNVGSTARLMIAGNRIHTFAGNGTFGVPLVGAPAVSTPFGYLQGVATDPGGNAYLADVDASTVWRVAADGIVSRHAGSLAAGFSGDGGPASAARLNAPTGLSCDQSGNLLITDAGNSRIRRVSAASGVITTVAGRGYGFGGDGGPATAARLRNPAMAVADGAGNLYIADSGNQRIRRVSPAGVITTVAGTGIAGASGDGGPALTATLNGPQGLVIDAQGDLLIADTGNHRIRKLTIATGIITTVAGTGVPAFGGDGGSALLATLRAPSAVAVDAFGSLYIGDTGNQRVRKVEGGIITTVAGTGVAGFSGDGGPGVDARLSGPSAIAFMPLGDLLVVDTDNARVRRVDGGTLNAVGRLGREVGDAHQP